MLSLDKVLATSFLGQLRNIVDNIFTKKKNNNWGILRKIIRIIDHKNPEKETKLGGKLKFMKWN
jgi:hypothetical protein